MSDRQPKSGSKLPLYDEYTIDDSVSDDTRAREPTSTPRDISHLSYTHPPIPRATATSSSRRTDSDSTSYLSNVSHQSSVDFTPTLVSSPTSLESLVTRGNETWSNVSLLGSIPWTIPEGWTGYPDFAFPTDQFGNWGQPQNETNWAPERAATAPIRTQVSSPTLSPTPIHSLVSYESLRPRQAVPHAFLHLDPNSEIPYPQVYPNPRASGAIRETGAPSAGVEVPRAPAVQPPAYLSDFGRGQTEAILPSSSAITEALAQKRAKDPERPRPVRSRSAAPTGSSRTKIFKVTKRRQPLDADTKRKAEEMRYYGACWRCRKYKKPCTGPGICDTCVTSGFRVWPSGLGCRRGDLDSFAFSILPTHAEQVLSELGFDYPKPVCWRKAPQLYKSQKTIPSSATNGDQWDQLLHRVQNTRAHGLGVLELLEIAIRFQKSREKENKVIANAGRTLSSVCDMYRMIVATDDPLNLTSPAEICNILSQSRKNLIASLSTFLNSCLTGRLKDWFPTFIAACVTILAYVLLGDAIVALPVQHRDRVWYDINAIVQELRQQLYPTVQDLLSALGKGSKLLNMRCWEFVDTPDEEPSTSTQGSKGATTRERNPEGMRMMDDDIPTFDGLRELQLWYETYGPMMGGGVWFSNPPYTVDILPIAAMERLFDFSPRA